MQDPPRTKHKVRYDLLWTDLAPRQGVVDEDDILTLASDTMLSNSPITWYVNHCAKRMRARTRMDVRVIQSDLLQHWIGTVNQTRDNGQPLKPDMHRAKLHAADFVFIVWYMGVHFSLLVLCHPGATIGQSWRPTRKRARCVWRGISPYYRVACRSNDS